MHKHLLFAVAATTFFAVGAPIFAQQDVGSTGSSDVYDRHGGRDYGFDNMKSDKTHQPSGGDELVTGADLVKQAQYADAIPHLELALAKKPDNSVTLLYLGFSHRMIGSKLPENARSDEYTKALGYYQKAAKIDPRNKLLHEYMGKLYLLMRDLPSANGELNTLVSLCPSGCEERDTLTNVIASYMVSMTPIVATTPPQKAK